MSLVTIRRRLRDLLLAGLLLAPWLASAADATVAEWLRRGAYREVIAALTPAPDAAVPPTVADSLALSQAQAALGQYEAALETLKRHLDSQIVATSLGEELTLRHALAQLYALRGQRAEAFTLWREIVARASRHNLADARALLSVGHALRALGATEPEHFKTALRFYQAASDADPQAVAPPLASADLLLEKYNHAEALEALAEVRQLDAEHPELLLLTARLQHFNFEPEALASAQRALAINPNDVAIHSFIAKLHLEAERYDEAAAMIVKAQAINPHHPAVITSHAAQRYLSQQVDAATLLADKSVHNADYFNELAELAARNRRYRDAADFARRAVEVDPQSWRGHGLLGMNALRLGEMVSGRQHLERAFAGDPYNVWIKNTLDLADTFSEYEVIQRPNFHFVIHRSEAELLAPYLIAQAEAAFAHFKARYRHRPATPIRVEVYPSHSDFSVRTVGLAGIGALGVSFGPVIAIDSPSARPVGEFHWASTLWHELAHTFHLSLSDQRVPRWFSEGLAVFEEHRAQPGWGHDVTAGLLIAYGQGRLPPLSRLNDAFVRPQYPEQIIFAYALGGIAMGYIESEYGFDAVLAMLAAYRAGENDSTAVPNALGRSWQRLDEEFDRYFRRRFSVPLAALANAPLPAAAPPLVEKALTSTPLDEDDYLAQLRAGRQWLEQQRYQEAERHLRRAVALFPQDGNSEGAYGLLAKLYAQTHKPREQAQVLAILTAINADAYPAHRQLGELLRAQEDLDGAAAALERARDAYPLDADLHQQLAEIYGQQQRWPEAVQAWRSVRALNPVDPIAARFQLARALFAAGDSGAARRELLATLERAPSYGPALELLLELRAGTKSD